MSHLYALSLADFAPAMQQSYSNFTSFFASLSVNLFGSLASFVILYYSHILIFKGLSVNLMIGSTLQTHNLGGSWGLGKIK